MIIHELKYEWIEQIFGTFIANHFNTISLILCGIGLVLAIILGRKIHIHLNLNQSNTATTSTSNMEILHNEENPTYNSRAGKWSPTGWSYDQETKRWDPPEYLVEESKQKWRWDEEKRIWIDQDKEKRLKRYQEYRKSQGREPTYEEWKAAREAEKHPD